MSREITRKLMSLALILALIVTPLGALGNILAPSHALQSGTTVDVFPTKIVKGQDILFTAVQRSGAFTPGAPIYIELSNSAAWSGQGAYWIGLKPGQSTIPVGSTIYVTAGLTAPVAGSSNLNEGSAWLLFSDSVDGSSGVVGPELTVEDWAGDYPVMCPYPAWHAAFYEPSDIITVTYSTNGVPQFTVASTNVKTASPGDTIKIYFYGIPGNSVKFYWDYYGGTLLATEEGGSGAVAITIPDAPEGFHAIVAVSDEGYGALTWIYVEPSLTPNKFSIQGKMGEKVTFTGKGFPANAQLDTHTDVLLHVYDGSNRATLHASIISGGKVDAKGNVQFTIELKEDLPSTMSGGIVDVEVPYASGDVDLQLGIFNAGELAPAGTDGVDIVSSVMAISSPGAYGDEFMVVFGPAGIAAPGPLGNLNVGQFIKVGVVDFPARTKVDIYFGPVVAGTLTTDENGAAIGYIKVPTLPGYDNSGTQITYTLKAIAVDPATHGYLVGQGVSGTYSAQIAAKVTIKWSPGGYGKYPTGSYLFSGAHQITITAVGLSPFAKVSIEEYLSPIADAKNVAFHSSDYNVVTEVGTKMPMYFVADANGVLKITYTVSYAKFLSSWSTGNIVEVRVKANTTTGTNILSATKQYKMISPDEYGDVPSNGVISSPATISPAVDREFGIPVVHPGDYIQIEFYSKLPNEKFKVRLDGSEVTMYNVQNKRVSYVKADNAGDVTVRIKLPNSSSIVGLHVVELVLYSGPAAGQTAAGFLLLVSSPNAGVYGAPTVYVFPQVVNPGDVIIVLGTNFESGETVIGGFSTLTSSSGTADAHGAVAFAFLVPYVPAGTYTVYITRTLPHYTAATTIEVVPKANVRAGPVLNVTEKAYGDVLTIDVSGLEPNKAYMVYWSSTYDELGQPLTDTGIPGYGTPLTWFSDSYGTITISFTVPFGVIGEHYFVNIVPADDPTHRILDPVEVIMIAGSGFELIDQPYVFVGQTFTVTLDHSRLDPYNAPGFSPSGWLNFLASEATITAMLSLPDGTIDVVPVSAVNLGNGLQLTFKMPNVNVTGDLGISFVFSYALYNSTSGDLDYSGTFVIDFGGIRVLQGGGIQLAKIENGIATIVSQNGQILQKLEELEPMIVSVSDGVAEIQTTLGTVTADLEALSAMLNNATVELMAKGDEIIATISTSAGQINATLQALMALMEETLGTLNTTQGLAGVLADMDAKLSNLATAVNSLSGSIGQVQASLSDVKNSLSSLSEAVGGVQAALDDVKSGVASTNSKLDNLADAVNSVSSDVSSVKSDLADVKNSLTTINSNVGDVKSSVSDVASKVDSLSDGVNSLAGKTTLVMVLDVIVLILALVIVALVFKKQG